MQNKAFASDIVMEIYPCPNWGLKFDHFHNKTFHCEHKENTCTVCKVLASKEFIHAQHEHLKLLLDGPCKFSCGCKAVNV